MVGVHNALMSAAEDALSDEVRITEPMQGTERVTRTHTVLRTIAVAYTICVKPMKAVSL
jgi:hypothetical protein